MKLVVKFGGAAFEDDSVVKNFARSVVSLVEHGHKIIVVHGGGSTLSRTLRALGHESQWVNGLRVTDKITRDVALMVLAGHLNKKLVATIGAAGKPAIGLCGGDLGLFRAAKKQQPDLGYVGEICRVDSNWINTIFWQHEIVPVVSSIALGNDGEYYNVNADQMAAACAVACNANALVFLTDVPGVKGADGSVIPYLAIDRIQGMIEASTVTGGMLPKLDACTRALEKGVNRVRILPSQHVEVLPGFFSQRIDYGTEVVIQ